MTWLEEILDATSELETPRKFFLWSALATVSAVAKNNVWVERYSSLDLVTVYPNIYVLLIAPSGFRKGVAVGLARALAKEAGGVKLISGRNSIQGIVSDLGNAKTTPGKSAPKVDSTAFINSGEFSTSLVRDPDALTILTDLYDGQYNKEWKNTLKHAGVDYLENVNLTILGGLNETHFNDMMSEKEITGGFIARCHLVLARERERKNALLRPTNKKLDLKKLGDYLREVAKLRGRFEITEEAMVRYETWYDAHDPEHTADKTGSAMRVHDGILKLAQCFAMAREPKLSIEDQDMMLAMRLCLESTANAGTIGSGAGGSEMALKQRSLLTALLRAPNYKITREKLLQNCRGDFDAFDLNRMTDTFTEAGIILQPYAATVEGRNQIIYELSGNTILEYSKK
jgi:hypothetical protein